MVQISTVTFWKDSFLSLLRAQEDFETSRAEGDDGWLEWWWSDLKSPTGILLSDYLNYRLQPYFFLFLLNVQMGIVAISTNGNYKTAFSLRHCAVERDLNLAAFIPGILGPRNSLVLTQIKHSDIVIIFSCKHIAYSRIHIQIYIYIAQ